MEGTKRKNKQQNFVELDDGLKNINEHQPSVKQIKIIHNYSNQSKSIAEMLVSRARATVKVSSADVKPIRQLATTSRTSASSATIFIPLSLQQLAQPAQGSASLKSASTIPQQPIAHTSTMRTSPLLQAPTTPLQTISEPLNRQDQTKENEQTFETKNFDITENDKNILLNEISTNFATNERQWIEETITLLDELRKWALRRHICQVDLNDLLQVLVTNGCKQFPRNADILLQPLSVISIQRMAYGELWYNGIQKCLQSQFYNHREEVSLNFNISRLPIGNGDSEFQFWPILANVVEDPLQNPMVVALYRGYGNPSDEMLKQFVDELNTVIKTGVRINEQTVKIKVNAILCNPMMQSFLKCK